MPELNRELADFLRRTRATIDPSHGPMPTDVRIRRVPGLRREEVALLAGISTDYYARLEQGRTISPSPSVLDAISRALHLNAAGRAHLRQLAGVDGSAESATSGRGAAQRQVRRGVHQLLNALERLPALVLGRRSDVLASNRLARAVFTDFPRLPSAERNYTRWIVLSDDAKSLFCDWDAHARIAVESLRLDVATYPEDRAAQELVTYLRAQSPHFQQWWEQHRVSERTHGSKRLRHPLVGELTLDYETLLLPGDQDQRLFLYTTEAGSSSRQALDRLADSIDR